jgi:hypothetical protein
LKKQFRILRLISGLFIIAGIVPFVSLLWQKITPFLILYLSVNLIIMSVVAFGLLKLMSWARWLAMFLLIITLAQSMFGAIRDIKIMIVHSAGSISIVFALVLSALLWAVIALLIWWLAKSPTKLLFKSNKTT